MADLSSVIVGALIAASSGGGVQWYMHRLKVEDELRRLRASKYEELVRALFDYHDWLKFRTRSIMYDAVPNTSAPSPFAKIRAIVIAYFPDFRDKARLLDRASDDYEMYAFQLRQKQPEPPQLYAQEEHDKANALFGVFITQLYTLLDDLDLHGIQAFHPKPTPLREKIKARLPLLRTDRRP